MISLPSALHEYLRDIVASRDTYGGSPAQRTFTFCVNARWDGPELVENCAQSRLAARDFRSVLSTCSGALLPISRSTVSNQVTEGWHKIVVSTLIGQEGHFAEASRLFHWFELLCVGYLSPVTLRRPSRVFYFWLYYVFKSSRHQD